MRCFLSHGQMRWLKVDTLVTAYKELLTDSSQEADMEIIKLRADISARAPQENIYTGSRQGTPGEAEHVRDAVQLQGCLLSSWDSQLTAIIQHLGDGRRKITDSFLSA